MTAAASSGSGWELKKAKGVSAPHSSPWKIMGVDPLSRVSTAAVVNWRRETWLDRRDPSARLPIWSWLSEKTTRRQVGVVGRSSRRPWRRPRNVEVVPSWKNPVSRTLASASRVAKSA
ncbi:Uncharacterised protein [Mycobacteroides abscessus subsp. abscessus]|nr:Uncharacterised protein [Mycobacteroides abscessus subsp. abscessus]